MRERATAAWYDAPHREFRRWREKIYDVERRATLIALCLCCLLIGCGNEPIKPVSPTTTETATTIEAKKSVKLETLSYDQLQARLKELRGRVIVLDCWATYCAPCLKEFPQLVELSRRHSADKLECVSLSFDNQGLDPLDKVAVPVQAFLDKQHAANVLNVISSDEDSLLYEKFGFAAIPAILVYDQQGKLVKQFPNKEAPKFDYGQVERLVAELLAQPAKE